MITLLELADSLADDVAPSLSGQDVLFLLRGYAFDHGLAAEHDELLLTDAQADILATHFQSRHERLSA